MCVGLRYIREIESRGKKFISNVKIVLQKCDLTNVPEDSIIEKPVNEFENSQRILNMTAFFSRYK